MSATSFWTDDRVLSLRTLWSEGLSASQIARRLAGGVSRNAVIGKVHRLGLSGRAQPALPRPRTAEPVARARTAARRAPSVAPAPPAVAPTAPESPGNATVLSVGAHACRWPIGDPLAEGFGLCGRPRRRGAYCAEHGALAYRRPEKDHLMKLAGLR